ncbi:MAG: glycosyltransferase family 4 protein [Syntrophales bacterium]|nr:glycosyltransferase family 4 protein [Syntrophales bacterium]
MKIAILSPIEESVPPEKYGGTELVVYNIVEELIKRGHEVTLFASGDSKTSAKLFYSYSKKIRVNPDQSLKEMEAKKSVFLGESLSKIRQEKFDIVHTHINWRTLPFLPLIDMPSVHTLHGPLNIDYQLEVYQRYKNANYITISNAQRKPLPYLKYLATVYNGIDIKKFDFNINPENYFSFLGRMSYEKGPEVAAKAAIQSGQKLKMAAKIDLSNKQFYDKYVKPLENKDVVYIGEPNHKEKNILLKNSKALLAPIQWEEPFGLYFIEAMACGTPVIAFKRGSVPEIVIDGKTGYVVDSKKGSTGIVEAIKKINSLSDSQYQKMRVNCRKHVEQNFTIEKMVDGYEKVYKKAITDWEKKNR